jgi:HSP20 family protein
MANMTAYNNGRFKMPALLGWGPTLFEELLGWRPAGSAAAWSAMPVTVRQDQDHVLVSADMPGVDPSDLDVTFERGSLAITGKRGDFTYSYSVYVGDDIDANAIEAQLDKGVLTIKAAKRPETKPRKIQIKGIEASIEAKSEAKSLESGEQK